MTARQRHTQQKGKYRHLIGITQQVVHNARGVLEKTKDQCAVDPMDDIIVGELRRKIDHYCQLGARVIDQSRRRVLEGEVATEEKIYSIFETHTDLIKRGKIQKPIEFGHKIFLAESAHGLITQYRVLEGNPPDHVHVKPSLQRHQETFGWAPALYSSDRGFFSDANIKAYPQVKLVCIPQRGGKRTVEREAFEKSPEFKGQIFRPALRAISPCCFAVAA